MKNILRVFALLLCIVFVFCSCSKKNKDGSQGELIPTNISSEESSSDSEESENQASEEEDTTPFNFEAVRVTGGTVVGTTSKGYKVKEYKGRTYIDGVLIVNKTYSLPQSYNPGLNSICNKAFSKMKAGAKKDGINVWISSGYRNYSRQETLYRNYCNSDGAAAADRFSARPGHSEHQAGLAIDVNSASTSAYNSTYKTVGEWIAEHCWEYGFILRYPQGKESITGYKYEPWHIRYVGIELSLKLKESGLTLEEYFGITSSYTQIEENEEESSSETQDNSESSSESEESGGASSENTENSDTSDISVDSENSSTENDENKETADSSENGETEIEGNETGSVKE